MSFRPFSLDMCRAWLAGLVCLAGMGISQAQDMRPQRIEIVPVRGSAMSTNVNQSHPEETRNFEDIFPSAARPYTPADSGQVAPIVAPQQQAVPSQRQKDWLDLRKNWVFMTPEDLVPGKNGDDVPGVKQYDKNGEEKKPTTAMERYYERLFNSNQAMATNQLGKQDSDRWNKETNSLTGMQRKDDDSSPFQSSPFDARPDPGIFQAARPSGFSDAFGSDADARMPSAASVRAQEEQQAHIDSFKQLWDLGQPAPGSSLPALGGSASEAGSFQGLPPVMGVATPSVSSSPAQANPASFQPAVTSTRALPLHPDFTAPQRRF